MKKSIVNCKGCGKEELVYNSRAISYTYCSKECMANSYRIIKFQKGDRINNWEIIDDSTIRKFGRTYIKVKCICGSNIVENINITHVKSKLHKGCKQCSRLYTSKGIGLLSGEYWSSLKNGATRRGIDFCLNIEYAWNIFLNQDKKCALTGMLLEVNENIERTASLDRIDSSKGYIEGNVQWVHKDVNIMKNKFDQDYFIKICKLICNKN